MVARAGGAHEPGSIIRLTSRTTRLPGREEIGEAYADLLVDGMLTRPGAVVPGEPGGR